MAPYVFKDGLVWKWTERGYVTADIVNDLQARLCWLNSRA